MGRFCPICGEKVTNERAKFCAGCGNPLDSSNTSTSSNFFDDVSNSNGNSGSFFDDASNAADNYTVEDAAKAGNMDAICELATTYFQQMDYPTARKWAKIGAGSNNKWCMHLMGFMAQQEENWREAIRWYERNIQVNSYYISASNLAGIYANFGENPSQPTDHAKAVYLFELAIHVDNEGDLAEHYVGLALCYLNFDDIDKSGIDVDKFRNLLQTGYNIASKIGDESSKKIARDILTDLQNAENEARTNNNDASNGCFVTTAVCDSFDKPDDCYELTMFRQFRDTWLRNQSDGEALIKEYYAIAPRIVSNINLLDNAKEVYRSIWTDYLKPCLLDLESDDKVSCKKRYVRMVMDLKEKYLK